MRAHGGLGCFGSLRDRFGNQTMFAVALGNSLGAGGRGGSYFTRASTPTWRSIL
jgi:hypothetical protein